jgi:hypothetical protein
MEHYPVACSTENPFPSSWVEMQSDKSLSAFIDWEALRKIAVAEKQRASTNEAVDISCGLSAACSEGGLHIV